MSEEKESKEPKQRFIKFAPAVPAPEPIDPLSIACSPEDYNTLIGLKFCVLHKSTNIVTFTKSFSLDNTSRCNMNIRFENNAWQCAIMIPNHYQCYDTFYSSKQKTLVELIDCVQNIFGLTYKFLDELSKGIKKPKAG